MPIIEPPNAGPAGLDPSEAPDRQPGQWPTQRIVELGIALMAWRISFAVKAATQFLTVQPSSSISGDAGQCEWRLKLAKKAKTQKGTEAGDRPSGGAGARL
ncbi:MAG: hypothetical protein MUP33_09155 [Polaromonas sp.]|nr:hypothetical protein [Polaromonas sp.]